jgi:hypothetical protein
VRDVEGVEADAMAADQTRPEGQEVPLGARGFQHVLRVDTEPIADQRYFVDQRDADVALVFSNTLANSAILIDRARWMLVDDAAVDRIDDVERLGRVGGNDLQDIAEAPLSLSPGLIRSGE